MQESEINEIANHLKELANKYLPADQQSRFNYDLDLLIKSASASELAINEDRLRIARDLHDLVIQRLFATGIMLEGALRKAVVDDVITAIRTALVDLDQTVGQIRSTIHSLKSSDESLRELIFQEIEGARQHWGYKVDFIIRGPVDTVVPTELYEDVIAVSRELLTNAGKHAKAKNVRYELETVGNNLRISLKNDETKSQLFKMGNGLINLSDRANKNQGELSIKNLEDGLEVSWQIVM